MITGAIFVVVGGLLGFVIIKFRARKTDAEHEPAQIYGSTQVELAWTVIPVLIVVVLFLTTARVIFAIQDAPKPQVRARRDRNRPSVLVGIPLSEARHRHRQRAASSGQHASGSRSPHICSCSRPTSITASGCRSSAEKPISFPTIPTRCGSMPQTTGLYLGQCAQFCGIEHAKMLLRVYVDTPDQFAAWVKAATAARRRNDPQNAAVAAGRHVFETEACVNCHTISGTAAKGTFGPDLTHLMSRATIAAGAAG